VTGPFNIISQYEDLQMMSLPVVTKGPFMRSVLALSACSNCAGGRARAYAREVSGPIAAPSKPFAALSTWAVAAVFLLASCASETSVSKSDLQKRQQALVTTDNLIVPGERVGPVRLGMAWDEVQDLLGKPDFSYVNTGDRLKIGTEMDYNSLNMEIYFNQSPTPRVTSIRVVAQLHNLSFSALGGTTTVKWGDTVWSMFDPVVTAFRTKEGVGIGSTSFDVTRALGTYRYDSGIDMKFDSLGLLFLVTKDHRVWSIGVNPPG
jgi:hypothetical protein